MTKVATLLGLLLALSWCFSVLGQPLTSDNVPSGRYYYLDKHYVAEKHDDPEGRSLVGANVFVTGITHGQGPEILRQYAEAGAARVVGCGSSDIAPPTFLTNALYFKVNITDRAQVAEMARSIYEDHGIDRFDVMGYNAGRMYNGYGVDNRVSDSARLIENNCMGNENVHDVFDQYGFFDHYKPGGTVFVFTGSIAHCSVLDGALDPYARSKSCVVDFASRLQIRAVLNGWTDVVYTLNPFGVFTNIGKFQFYPQTPSEQLVCSAETAFIQSLNAGSYSPAMNDDLYDPAKNLYDQTTVVDIGKYHVMLARYVRRSSFQPSLYVHFVVLAGFPLDASSTGDWDFWADRFNENPLRYALLLQEKSFAQFYPRCSAVHVQPDKSASPSPSPIPTRKPHPTKRSVRPHRS